MVLIIGGVVLGIVFLTCALTLIFLGAIRYCNGEFSWQKAPPPDQSQQIQVFVGPRPSPAQQIGTGCKAMCTSARPGPRAARRAAPCFGVLAFLALVLFIFTIFEEMGLEDEHKRLIEMRVDQAATEFRKVGCIVIREERQTSDLGCVWYCRDSYGWVFRPVDEPEYAGEYTSRAVNVDNRGHNGRNPRLGIPPPPDRFARDVCNDGGDTPCATVPCWVPTSVPITARRWEQCSRPPANHEQECSGIYQCANDECVKLFDPLHEVLMMSDYENYDDRDGYEYFNPYRDENYAEFPMGYKGEFHPFNGSLLLGAIFGIIACCCRGYYKKFEQRSAAVCAASVLATEGGPSEALQAEKFEQRGAAVCAASVLATEGGPSEALQAA